ncbi:MAG: hypothetical protein HC901_00565 [Bdellovibrionaceae bacterium]|nr:hypothetical protein [Pseudobdellovibrionaceae bacterium]
MDMRNAVAHQPRPTHRPYIGNHGNLGMSDSVEETDAKLSPLMAYFGERFNRVFAYFFCVLEFEGDADLNADPTNNDRAWTLQIIKNACMSDTLIALRDLDDFLSPQKSKARLSDIKTSDFGLKTKLSFLTETESKYIHQLVAHTTTVGAQNHGFRWDILELTTKCISQSLEFLKWVEKEYGLAHFNLYTAAIIIRNRTKSQFEFITREAEKRRVM